MGIFDIFKRKKDKEINKEELNNKPEDIISTNITCEYCGRDIFGEQKTKTFMNKKYHLICFRKLQKEAKNTLN